MGRGAPARALWLSPGPSTCCRQDPTCSARGQALRRATPKPGQGRDTAGVLRPQVKSVNTWQAHRTPAGGAWNGGGGTFR